MNEELKKAFDKWIEEDLPYSGVPLTEYEKRQTWLWFQRGYNHSLVEISRLQDEVKSLNEKDNA